MTNSSMAFNPSFHQSPYNHVRTSHSFIKNHNTLSKAPFPLIHYSIICYILFLLHMLNVHWMQTVEMDFLPNIIRS